MNFNKYQKQEELESIIKEKIKNSPVLIDASFILEKISYQPNTNDFLYHYTSLSTLEKIIKNNELWATHLSYMNDSKEVIDGLDYLNNFIKRIDEKIQRVSNNQVYFLGDIKPSNQKSEPEKIVDEKADKLVTESNFNNIYLISKNLRKFLDITLSFLNSSEIKIQSYASCFSLKKDQLSQWRAYGSMGCSIAFDSSELLELFGIEIYDSDKRVVQKMVQALYDDEKKTQLATDLIVSIIEVTLLILEDEEIKEKNGSVLNQTELVRLIVENILHESFWIFDLLISSYKHSSFSEEDEVRLLYLDYGNHSPNPPKVNVRLNKSFIPYYVFSKPDKNDNNDKPKNQELPIREIYLSPEFSNDFNRVAYGIKILLKENGYDPDKIEIKPSSSPYNPS